MVLTVSVGQGYIPSLICVFESTCLKLDVYKRQPDFNVDELCRGVGLSRPAVYKKVKSLTGLSVVEFIRCV